MWPWSRNKQKPVALEPDLKGKPARSRTKTYSAETGRVYQYLYKGWRYLAEISAREYVFYVVPTREAGSEVRVRLLDSAISECNRSIGREVLDAEKYAIAKLTLFAAFDRLEEVDSVTRPVIPGPADMETCLRSLGRI